MKENLQRSIQFEDEEILAGLKFKMQYLGCGEELRCGGTDHEIANVIHDIHALYARNNTKPSKARAVVVFVDSEKISVFDENEDEMLLTLSLVYVKDVTACLNQTPYSKTCVLVAKQYNDPLYKAFVFYCKTTARAADFYNFTRSAFQLGFKRMENESLSSCSLMESGSSESSSYTPDGSLRNEKFQEMEKNRNDYLDDEDGECDTLDEFSKNIPESQTLLNHDTDLFHLNNKDQSKRKGSIQRPQTVTICISNKNTKCTTYDKQEMKFNLNLGDSNNNANSSKIGDLVDTFGETSQYLIPNWLRNSYRKFRKMSDQRSACETV